ncbi:hypothetical protein HA052_04050 [Chromobacterium haemolyticum]|uniref:Uncharacterized protein n=1 Tax=Chromobacterium fluminis TaxID=3044269 RepID=A0ABX0L3Z7_9NEIS|nr:hypothetical protein [Chromobacterium haemolyticum]NHR04362.1 hypothetical protein [Chromobacterium haemolyticum]
MTTHTNFPHRVGVTCAFYLMEKLPICKLELSRTERALIGALLPFLDSKDFALPITITTRKKLGNLAQLGRSALYETLRSLEQRKLIERQQGNSIRFTQTAIAMLAVTDKEGSTKHAPADDGAKFFRIGRFRIPTGCMKLVSAGVSAEQIVRLMKVAKQYGKKLQDIVQERWKIFSKYSGDVLFRVAYASISGKLSNAKSDSPDHKRDDFSKLPILMKKLLLDWAERGLTLPDRYLRFQKIEGIWWVETNSKQNSRRERLTIEMLNTIVIDMRKSVSLTIPPGSEVDLSRIFGGHGKFVVLSYEGMIVNMRSMDSGEKLEVSIHQLFEHARVSNRTLLDVLTNTGSSSGDVSEVASLSRDAVQLAIGDVLEADGAATAKVDSIEGESITLRILEGVDAGRTICVSLMKLLKKTFTRIPAEEWGGAVD